MKASNQNANLAIKVITTWQNLTLQLSKNYRPSILTHFLANLKYWFTISFVPHIVCLHSFFPVPDPFHHWLKSKEDPWSSSVVSSAVRSVFSIKTLLGPKKTEKFPSSQPNWLNCCSFLGPNTQPDWQARGFNMNLIRLSLTPPTFICSTLIHQRIVV